MTTVRRTRSDTLPEGINFKDDGCTIRVDGVAHVIPRCETCPLPRCKYDDPGWLARNVRDERDKMIIARSRRGLPLEDIATEMNVSKRTVHRVLRVERGGKA